MSALAALPAPSAFGRKPPLSRKAKAAIIVQFLLNEGADVPLSALPDESQSELTHLLGNMRYVDNETLHAVVEEFSNELESIGLAFPGDMAGALDALDGKINAHTAMRLRKEAGVRQSGNPWDRINAQTVERLKDLVLSESTEVAAVMMSKIDVGKAAQILALLPGDRARRISYAVSMTTGVTPDAVDRIGLSLAAQIDAEPLKAFKARPDERLGAILNYSNTTVREEVLRNLEQEDAVFADAVRRAIFTFGNIPERLKPTDVPKLTRDVETATLAIAMSAAANGTEEDQKTVEFLYGNMTKRLAESIREETNGLGEVKPKAGEKAMSAVVAAIRELVNVGEIELVTPDEE